jgi:tRNA(Leu) C34 or U34 (ribose-2'-O)-methylase TrmL
MNTAVLLLNAKSTYNVAAAIRACAIFGIPWLRWTGNRVKKPHRAMSGSSRPRLPREERMKAYVGVDWRADEKALDDFIAEGCVPVAVEIRDAAESLPDFVHPQNAVYVFGPEDGSIPKGVLSVCHRFLRIPSADRTPLNLAAAVNIVLYDRYVKQLQKGEEHVHSHKTDRVPA